MDNQSITCLRLPPTHWKGSRQTADMVRKQITQRFGPEAAEAYDPTKSARPFQEWLRLGFKVKQGEKGLKSLIFLDLKDKQGKVVGRRPKIIFLFHERSVEPIDQS